MRLRIGLQFMWHINEVKMHSTIDIASSPTVSTWLLAGAIIVGAIASLDFRNQGTTDIVVTGWLICFKSQHLPNILPSPSQVSWSEDSGRVEYMVCVSMVCDIHIL